MIPLEWKVRKNTAALAGRELFFTAPNGEQQQQNPGQRMQCLVTTGNADACIKYFALF